MRIMYVVSNIRRCGPVSVVLSLVKNLSADNEVCVVSLFSDRKDDELIAVFKKAGANVKVLNLSKKLFVLNSRSFEGVVKSFKPDIIHSHGLQADIIVARLKNDAKKVSTLHSDIFVDYRYRLNKLISGVLVKYRVKLFKRFNKSICCSESVRDAMVPRINLPLSFIRNGINLDSPKTTDCKKIRNSIRKEFGISCDSTVFLYCGSLIRLKRVPELISLFKTYAKNNDYLVILGGGQELEQCREAATDNIIVLGNCSDVYRYYIASDVYLSNSTSEGLSMSVLEALKYNNYLLLSNIPSHKECLEMIPDLKYGELFDENGFAQALSKVSTNVKKQKITTCVYEISDKRMADEYFATYKEMLNEQ